MLEKSFGLYFYLKQSKNQKNATRYVYMRITVDGKSTELSTKRLWYQEKWNGSAGRATGNKEDARNLNSYLEVLAAKVYQAKKVSPIKKSAPKLQKRCCLERMKKRE